MRYQHHLTFIIQTKLLGIIFAIDYIIKTPTPLPKYCPQHSIRQLPAMFWVLIYIHLALSLVLAPIVILKYNSDYRGDCGVIKTRFICMIMVNNSNNPNICQLASYYYLQAET